MPGPVWLEGDLHDFPMLGLASGDALGSLETGPVERNHVGILGASPVVRRPDAGAVAAISASRASNAGTGGQKNLGPGKVAGVQKIPAVNVARCERPTINEGARVRVPGRTSPGRVEFGQMLAAEFESIAPVHKRDPARGQALEFSAIGQPHHRAAFASSPPT